MSISGRKYRAFICYSQQDREAAERLHHRLETYRVPRRLAGQPARLGPIFRDREELAASADIGERLRAALADTEFLIVLCSPAAAQSRWVNAEIAAFCALSPAHRERVLAVIAAGEPGAADPAQECFPVALRRVGDADVLGPHHPLAADFRRGRDRRADAELRLIAALLGVEFDELRQREQERRVARLKHGLMLVSLVALTISGLTAYAFAQRNHAKFSAEAAAAAAARATSARSEAEKLVDYILNDLRPSLEKIGKLELLEPANEKVRAYYATVTPAELDLAMLRRQGKAFHDYAVDLRSHKRGGKTRSILETAALLRRRVTELAPRDPASWQDLAETHRYLALQRRDDGDIAGGLEEIALARKYARIGMALDPSNLISAARLASLPADEGEMLIRGGRTKEAQPLLESALAQLEHLAARDPTENTYLDRAAAVAWQLGNVHRRSGDYAAAEAVYRRGLACAESLCERAPANIIYLRRRELAAGTLGQLFLEAGRFEDAASQIAESLIYARAILAVDPRSLVYQDALATSLGNMAETEKRLTRVSDARAHIREAVEARERIIALGATEVRARHTLALTLATWSTIESGDKQHAFAASIAARGVEVMKELNQKHPADIRLADDYAFLRATYAAALQHASDFEAAEREYRAAITQVEAVIAREPVNPQLARWRDRASWCLGQASAMLELGRGDDARAMLMSCLEEYDRLGKAGLPETAYAEDRGQAASLLARLPFVK